MSVIRCIYTQGPPNFPASDQHPDAARYTIFSNHLGKEVTVDAIGVPTTQEVDDQLNPPPRSLNELEADCLAYLNGGSGRVELRKAIKAHIISCEAYRLGVAPGTLTVAQLVAIRNRIAAIYKAL